MPTERYYLPCPLNLQDTVCLIETEHHHFVHVMRGKVGDEIELINGLGVLSRGVIQSIEKKKTQIEIFDRQVFPAPQKNMTLLQALPRANRLDTIVEKGTELGMTALWLFPGERSERKELAENQLDRLKAVAVAAMKQSGQLFIPDICSKPRLAKWQPPPLKIFYGDLSIEAEIFQDSWQKNRSDHIGFFIGPESGFSPDEIAIFKGWDCIGVKLHPNILRTDTAAITAMSLISHWQQR